MTKIGWANNWVIILSEISHRLKYQWWFFFQGQEGVIPMVSRIKQGSTSSFFCAAQQRKDLLTRWGSG